MDIGLGLFTNQLHPEDPRDHPAIYRDMLKLARHAEDRGFASVWTSEHHFADTGYLSSSTTALAALATATDRIQIGCNILVAPLHDQPLRLAEDLATVDILSGGRLRVGLGNGYRQAEFEGFGIPTGERGQRTEEMLRILRDAWDEGPSSFDGEIYEHPEVSVTPRPVQPDGPPLILGGQAEVVLERAARLADGYTLMIGAFSDLEGVTNLVTTYRDYLRKHDRNPSENPVYVLQNGFLHPEEEQRHRFRNRLEDMARNYGRWARGDGLIQDLEEFVSGWLDQALITGDPARFRQALSTYRDRLGPNLEYIYCPAIPGVQRTVLRESLDLVAEEFIES